MNIAEKIESGTGLWRRAEPASAEALAALFAATPIQLPESYAEFLRYSNGGEGDLAVQPWWFCPWRAEDVLERNDAYEMAKWSPGFFGFGTDGGGDIFAFDIRACSPPWPIVLLPFPLDVEDLDAVASNFDEFAKMIGTEGDKPELPAG